MPRSPLPRLRKLCLALPEAHEVEAWGEPTFRVRNKLFAMYADAGNHHGNGRSAGPRAVLRTSVRGTEWVGRHLAGPAG